MLREFKPDNISYKHRKLRIDGQWIPVGKQFELNDVKVNQAYQFELLQTLEGEYYINSIKKGGPLHVEETE